jgi:hypothetical protein
MVRIEVKISMKKKYSACLYFKLLKSYLYENFEKRGVVEKKGEEETKSMPHAPVIKDRSAIYLVRK